MSQKTLLFLDHQILAFKEMGKARDNESKVFIFTKIFDNEDDLTSAE